MWLTAAVLVGVLSVNSFGYLQKFKLDATNPSVTFQTPRYPRLHAAKVSCIWVISAPGNVAELFAKCKLHIKNSPNCTFASFSFTNYDKKDTICEIKRLSLPLKGSTNIFSFESNMCVNIFFKGVSCTVSYNPEDIPTCTIPVNASCTCGEKKGQRIIGGNETLPNEHPWQAMLIYKSSRGMFCGASLIHEQWVLSAAHCVVNESLSSILVVLGEHDYISLSSSIQEFEVAKITIHENYGPIMQVNDIALLKLSTTAVINQVVSPICLPFNYKYHDFTKKTGIITGWGQTITKNNQSYSKALKQIDQIIIMPSKCTKLDGYSWAPQQITENMICAVAKNRGTSNGDSGGPMVWKSDSSNLYFQLGVTSFGPIVSSWTKPFVYARVSQFVEWIMAETEAGKEFCVKM